jgi:hypothetical protein
MEFEWDPEKRLSNIKKHGIDFIHARIVFQNPYIRESAKSINGELRWLVIGLIDEDYVTVVYTLRGSVIRIISMRKARNGERRKHQEIFGC